MTAVYDIPSIQRALRASMNNPCPEAISAVNDMNRIRRLATLVGDKLELGGYDASQESVTKAICEYADVLSRPWKGINTVGDRVFQRAMSRSLVFACEEGHSASDIGLVDTSEGDNTGERSPVEGRPQGNQNSDADGDESDGDTPTDGQGNGQGNGMTENGDNPDGDGNGDGRDDSGTADGEADDNGQASESDGDGESDEDGSDESDGSDGESDESDGGDDESDNDGDKPDRQAMDGEETTTEEDGMSNVPQVPDMEIENDGYIKPKVYDMVEDLINSGFKVLLTGPRGTGKTELAMRIARKNEYRFFMLTSPQERTEVTGYADAVGNEVKTEITKAVTEDCMLLIEEMDRSMPEALIPLNAMLANGVMDVPVRGVITVSPDCRIIATANTSGTGANEEYGTANKLDASTLDRFVVVHMDYEHDIDVACAGGDLTLVKFIEDWRHACDANMFTSCIVSYRGVSNIAKLIKKYDVDTVLKIALIKSAIGVDELRVIYSSLEDKRNKFAMSVHRILDEMSATASQ